MVQHFKFDLNEPARLLQHLFYFIAHETTPYLRSRQIKIAIKRYIFMSMLRVSAKQLIYEPQEKDSHVTNSQIQHTFQKLVPKCLGPWESGYVL